MSEEALREAGNRVRGRNIDFPDVAPISASDSAQTQGIPLDLETIRQFSFGQSERSTVLERPSTSGGPVCATDFGVRRDAWKRETRDDLDFLPPSHTKQTIFYDFPRPGGLPTPDSGLSSPGSFLPLRKDSLAPSSIAESDGIIEVDMTALQMEIGMAIGSPTQAPPSWQTQSFRQDYNPSPDVSIEARLVTPPTRQKSKWKVFGGLFGGKKQAAQPQNFYQLKLEKTPVEDVRAQPIRGWTTSEQHAGKQKPPMQRSQTAPTKRNETSNNNPEILIDASRVEENVQLRPQAGLLNVDIPNVEMERYSVMFGSLLGKPTESTPSLLTRRQATLERLKVANEELVAKEKELEEKEKRMKQPRRATSPQPTRSPAFSLFPNTPSRDSRASRSISPNGLARSNTSPAALSPSRPSFAPGSDNEMHAKLVKPGPHIPVVGGHEEERNHLQIHRTRAVPPPLTLKKPDLPTIVKMAQAQVQMQGRTTTTITAQQPHPHPLRSFSISRRTQIDPPPQQPLPTPARLRKQSSLEPLHKSSLKMSPSVSVSGSTTSKSDHSASASGSSVSTSEILGLDTYQVAPSRSPSPQSTSVAKQLPIPMSKFTAPPQTHKTRGRSQTTSTPSNVAKSSLPRPASRPRNVGPVEISGPTNLSSTPPPVSLSPNTSRLNVHKETSNGDQDDEDEARLSRLADVSIARQISVSRQQRQLLVPIKGSFKAKPTAVTKEVTTTTPQILSPPQSDRPALRGRASTVSINSPGSKIHNQNFPSPLQNLQSPGVNVAHLTSPLAAVEQAANEFAPSNTTSHLPRLKKKESRKDILHESRKGNTPTLVVVSGNGQPRDDVESWEGATPSSKKDAGIAERRRNVRAEKFGGNVAEQRRGHEYKKSEKVVVERI